MTLYTLVEFALKQHKRSGGKILKGKIGGRVKTLNIHFNYCFFKRILQLTLVDSKSKQ